MGCENKTAVEGEDFATFDAVVEGQILKSDGSPIIKTNILITSYTSDCDDRGEGISHGSTTSDAEGNFKRQILKPTRGESIKCLTLDIPRGQDDTLPDTMVVVSTDLELKLSEPYEKETVNIHF